MATKVGDVDLKRIELKVSVNCCEGCKRKVKKLLRPIEGVLKTEIDIAEPKVRVIGNVDPKILIKKLMRSGKHAELLTCSNNKSEPNKDEEQIKKLPAKLLADNCGNNGEEKCNPNLSSTSTAARDEQKSCSEVIKENPKTADGSRKKKKSSKNHHKKADCYDGHPAGGITSTTLPVQALVPETITTPIETPSLVVTKEQDDFSAIQPGMVHYAIEPSSNLHGPSYYSTTTSTSTMDAYVVAPRAFPSMIYYGGANNNNHGYSVYESSGAYAHEQQAAPITFLPELQPPVPRVGDYFSVENTVGCQIM